MSVVYVAVSWTKWRFVASSIVQYLQAKSAKQVHDENVLPFVRMSALQFMLWRIGKVTFKLDTSLFKMNQGVASHPFSKIKVEAVVFSDMYITVAKIMAEMGLSLGIADFT